MLEVGSKAPDFTLNDKDGTPVSLSDFRGKIEKVLPKVKPDTNAQEILAYLRQAQ